MVKYIENVLAMRIQMILCSRSICKLLIASSLALGGGSAWTQARTAPPSVIAVSGAVNRPSSLDLSALKAFAPTDVVVASKTYTGANLWTLLNAVGLSLDPARRNPAASMFVIATGDDGYKAVFSLAEIDPALGNRPVLVAYAVDGAALGDVGTVRLVVPADLKPSRAVFRLAELRVASAP